MNVYDQINKVADILETRGWVQVDGWHPEPGSVDPVCVEGAMNALLGRRNKFVCPVYLAVAEHLSHRDDVTLSNTTGLPILWAWNDQPGRTQAEVVEVLRAAAVVAAARESASALVEVSA